MHSIKKFKTKTRYHNIIILNPRTKYIFFCEICVFFLKFIYKYKCHLNKIGFFKLNKLNYNNI